MRFTPTTAALILAYTSSVFAAPGAQRREEATAVESAAVPEATDPASTPPPPEAPAGLSVTQQLILSDLAADRFNILKNDGDFKFSLEPGDIPEGQGGVLKAANRKTFPALVGTGGGMAVGRIKPCGINTFHVHPRSAELQMVISGELVTEMVPENGVRPIRNTVGAFEMTPFYQGSVHHQFNPKCEDAVFVAAFASEDPGTGSVVNEVFELDKGAIVDTFGGTFSGEMVDLIKDSLPKTVVQGVQTCLKTCGGKAGDEEEEGEEGESPNEGQVDEPGNGEPEGHGDSDEENPDEDNAEPEPAAGNEPGSEVGDVIGVEIGGEGAEDMQPPPEVTSSPEN